MGDFAGVACRAGQRAGADSGIPVCGGQEPEGPAGALVTWRAGRRARDYPPTALAGAWWRVIAPDLEGGGRGGVVGTVVPVRVVGECPVVRAAAAITWKIRP